LLCSRYAFTYQKSKESKAFFIIGIDVDDYFENAGVQALSALTFGNAIGTKLKFDIIEELRKGIKQYPSFQKAFCFQTTIDVSCSLFELKWL
jgi:hypothetical protein